MIALVSVSCYRLPMVQAEITKTGSENALSTIRKFSRKVQGAGLVKTVRGARYFKRPASKAVKKKHALKLIKRRTEYQRLLREGKITEPVRNNFRENSSPRPQAPTMPPIAH